MASSKLLGRRPTLRNDKNLHKGISIMNPQRLLAPYDTCKYALHCQNELREDLGKRVDIIDLLRH